MAKKIKKGKVVMWVDGSGAEVPEKYVDPVLKERDKFVSRQVAKARQMRMLLTNFKRAVEAELADFLAETAARAGEEWAGGTTLYNFSMDEAVTIKVHKYWAFDERLQLAKQKIDKVIEQRSEGADELIVALVNRAFKVNSRGQVDSRELIGLRQMKVDDPLWQEAMEMIADSMLLQDTKTYFYFQQAGEDGKMERIVLDFASL